MGCLYMTVLGFDNITYGFILQQCVTESILGALVGVSAIGEKNTFFSLLFDLQTLKNIKHSFQKILSYPFAFTGSYNKDLR